MEGGRQAAVDLGLYSSAKVFLAPGAPEAGDDTHRHQFVFVCEAEVCIQNRLAGSGGPGVQGQRHSQRPHRERGRFLTILVYLSHFCVYLSRFGHADAIPFAGRDEILCSQVVT